MDPKLEEYVSACKTEETFKDFTKAKVEPFVKEWYPVFSRITEAEILKKNDNMISNNGDTESKQSHHPDELIVRGYMHVSSLDAMPEFYGCQQKKFFDSGKEATALNPMEDTKNKRLFTTFTHNNKKYKYPTHWVVVLSYLGLSMDDIHRARTHDFVWVDKDLKNCAFTNLRYKKSGAFASVEGAVKETNDHVLKKDMTFPTTTSTTTTTATPATAKRLFIEKYQQREQNKDPKTFSYTESSRTSLPVLKIKVDIPTPDKMSKEDILFLESEDHFGTKEEVETDDQIKAKKDQIAVFNDKTLKILQYFKNKKGVIVDMFLKVTSTLYHVSQERFYKSNPNFDWRTDLIDQFTRFDNGEIYFWRFATLQEALSRNFKNITPDFEQVFLRYHAKKEEKCVTVKGITYPNYYITDTGVLSNKNGYMTIGIISSPDSENGRERRKVSIEDTKYNLEHVVLETFVSACPPGHVCRPLDFETKDLFKTYRDLSWVYGKFQPMHIQQKKEAKKEAIQSESDNNFSQIIITKNEPKGLKRNFTVLGGGEGDHNNHYNNTTKSENNEEDSVTFITKKRLLSEGQHQVLSYSMAGPLDFLTCSVAVSDQIKRSLLNRVASFYTDPNYPRKGLSFVVFGDKKYYQVKKTVLDPTPLFWVGHSQKCPIITHSSFIKAYDIYKLDPTKPFSPKPCNTIVSLDNYLMVSSNHKIDQQYSRSKRYYNEHRIIYCAATGLCLDEISGYDIDHRDQNKWNQTIENLILMDHKEHTQKTKQDNPDMFIASTLNKPLQFVRGEGANREKIIFMSQKNIKAVLGVHGELITKEIQNIAHKARFDLKNNKNTTTTTKKAYIYDWDVAYRWGGDIHNKIAGGVFSYCKPSAKILKNLEKVTEWKRCIHPKTGELLDPALYISDTQVIRDALGRYSFGYKKGHNYYKHWKKLTLSTCSLMYAAFHGPIPEGSIIRHKNDKHEDVCISDLELGTYSDNMIDFIGREVAVYDLNDDLVIKFRSISELKAHPTFRDVTYSMFNASLPEDQAVHFGEYTLFVKQSKVAKQKDANITSRHYDFSNPNFSRKYTNFQEDDDDLFIDNNNNISKTKNENEKQEEEEEEEVLFDFQEDEE